MEQGPATTILPHCVMSPPIIPNTVRVADARCLCPLPHPRQVVQFMTVGKQNRAVGAHDMNEHSSRSHSILSIRVRGENQHDRRYRSRAFSYIAPSHPCIRDHKPQSERSEAGMLRGSQAGNANISITASRHGGRRPR
jgi:hypothetical protein